MFYGWVACNLLFWACNLSWMVSRYNSWGQYLGYAFLIGLYTGAVIMLAWITIFLPVDMLLPDDSFLRKPAISPVFGFIAGSIVPILLRPNPFGRELLTVVLSGNLEMQDIPFAFGPGITGMVAAFIRSLDTIQRKS